MKSVKPGRGPSFMGGVGAAFAVIFGIIWTIAAASMGASGFMVLFGVVFVLFGAVSAVYHFSNATRKNRYSAFDITDHKQEPDPFNARMSGGHEPASEEKPPAAAGYCPYCGAKAGADHAFCRQCGREL